MKTAVFGSYCAADSVLHKLDPRVKILGLFFITPAIFSISGSCSALFSVALLLGLLLLGKVPLPQWFSALIPSSILMLFVVLANTFVFDASYSYQIFGSFGISVPGALRALLSITRILLLIWSSLVLCATTSSYELCDSLAWLLKPLAVFGLRVGDIAMVMSIALRFIPVCAEELEQLAAAGRSRGLSLTEGGAIKRLRAWSKIFVPLLVSLARRAEALGQAMLGRGYSSRYRSLFLDPWSARLSLELLACFCIAVALICLGHMEVMPWI